MRILGIDPGTVRMGYGAVDCQGREVRLVECGVLTAPSGATPPQRLLALYRGLEAVLVRLQPQEVAVEEPFLAKNPRSALALGRAQALAILAAAGGGWPVHFYTPAQVKKRVAGYGAGDKAQVAHMVARLLGLDATPQPSDAADALALAVCHAFQLCLPPPLRRGR